MRTPEEIIDRLEQDAQRSRDRARDLWTPEQYRARSVHEGRAEEAEKFIAWIKGEE